jgi:NADH:ubiquinone reductase (H+-translocating)
MAPPRVVIVGGGFGGLAVARGLASVPVGVTLVDRNNYHLFQPLLYQVATAGLSPAQIATPIRSVFRRQRNVEVLMAELRRVDVAARTVELDHGVLPFDHLVLATGSVPHYFGHEAWARSAPGLKTVEDAVEIRRDILLGFELAEREPDPAVRRELLTFVCIGGGPTGVEMAGAISEIARAGLAKEYRHIDPGSARVILIESGPRILASFAEPLAEAAHRRLVAMGVEVRTGSPVLEVGEHRVVLRDGPIAARCIVWTAGVAATAVGEWLGVPAAKGGRVAVGEDLSVPGLRGVFVIGDAAHVVQDGRPLPGVAPVAKQQGAYVARVIRSQVAGTPPPPPFRYRDKGNLATVGRAFAVAEFRRARLAGFFAWLTWLGVHIVYLIGFRNRLFVLLEWAWAYVTFQRSARIISNPDRGADRRAGTPS